MGDGVGRVGRRGGPSIGLTPALSPAFCCLVLQLHDDLEVGLVGRGPSSEGSRNTTPARAGFPKWPPQTSEAPPLSPEQACPGACLRGALGGWGGGGLGQWPEARRGEAGPGADGGLGVNRPLPMEGRGWLRNWQRPGCESASVTNKVCAGGKPCNPLSLKLLCKIRQRGRRGLRDLRRSGHRAPAVMVPGL